MSKIHQCPEEICRRLGNGSETEKAKARAEAIEWLKAQRIEMGDTVLMPDPQTGALTSFRQTTHPAQFGRA